MHEILVFNNSKADNKTSYLIIESGNYDIDITDISGRSTRAIIDFNCLDNNHTFYLGRGYTNPLTSHFKDHKYEAIISN